MEQPSSTPTPSSVVSSAQLSTSTTQASTQASTSSTTYNEAPVLTALPEKSVSEMTDAELSAKHAHLRMVAFQPQTLAAHLSLGLDEQKGETPKKKRESKNASTMTPEQIAALKELFA